MDTNLVISKEKEFVDRLCTLNNYDNNIKHLLYVIVPAFVIKYGVNKENIILNTFRETKIIVSNDKDKIVKAYYTSKLKRVDNEYSTTKYMVLNDYENTTLIDLLDNLVHEYNHAVNSYLNEIKETGKYIYLRTGLTYRAYNKEDLSFIKKTKSYMLEEIINTKQTEEIINIMKEFDENNTDISNTIYAINSETNHKYNSNSYYLESQICKQILENKTFINTLAGLRFNGEIYDITKWFDTIIGRDGAYKELIQLLNDMYDLEIEYTKRKFFKKRIINQIRNYSDKIINIVNEFNNNVNVR